MKKTIVLLLSLILLFSFVSCNGSTNSPSDSGSSNKPSSNEPQEITPPNKSEWVEMSDEQYNTINNALGNLKTSLIKDYCVEEFTFNSSAKIGEESVSGHIQQKMDMVAKVMTIDGNLSCAGANFVFNNCKLNIASGIPSIISGTITKNGSPVVTEDFNIISNIMSNAGKKENYSKYTVDDKSIYKMEGNEVNITGLYSMSYQMDLEKKVEKDIYIIDASIDGKPLQFKQVVDRITGNNSIEYFGLDGSFFTEESIIARFPYGIYYYLHP